MSPDGLDVEAESLPTRWGRAGLQPLQYAGLQAIPFRFHFSPDRMDETPAYGAERWSAKEPGGRVEKERAQPLVLFTES